MIRLWPTIPASLALLISAGSANAAPLLPEPTSKLPSMIEKVHGTHRPCAYSAARGWHRHIGPYNRAVSCGYDYDDPYYFDPFWGSPGLNFWFGERPRYRDRPYRQYRQYRFQRPVPGRDGVRRRR